MANRNITLKRNNAGTTEELYPTTDWAQVNNKPSTFTPTSHNHTLSDITDAGTVAAIDLNSSTTQYLRGDGTWQTVTSGSTFNGGTITGNLEISNTLPKITLTDTDHNSDFNIANNNGVFTIGDTTNQLDRFKVLSNGNIEITGTQIDIDGSPLNNIGGALYWDGDPISIDGHNHNTLYYTKSQTDTNISTAISNLVDSSPAALDTLNELAAALGDDPNFATTVSNNIGTKVSKSGDTMTGNLSFSNDSTGIQLYGDNSLKKVAGTGIVMTTDSTRGLDILLQFERGAGGTKYKAFHDGYHPNADRWTTARTLSLSGDASGSVSWSGSGNATLSVTVANDSHTHDGRYYTESEVNSLLAGKQNTIGTNSTFQIGSININDPGVNEGITWLGGNLWKIYESPDNQTNAAGNLQFVQNSTRRFTLNTNGEAYLGSRRVFHDGYHPNADKWTTARTITLGGDLSGSVSLDGSANVTLSAQVTNNSHTHSTVTDYAPYIYTRDNRTIAPSEDSAYRLRFGFTSWANNNSSPYADYLHLRSYSDSSGGSDNLVMFKKSGIGMRIWQQSFGSGTAYSNYVDVIDSSTIGSQSVNYANSAGNADTVDGVHESTFMRRSANSQLDMNNNDIVGVDQIIHEGDTNTYMQFHAADQWRVVTGGAERLEVNNSETKVSQNFRVTGNRVYFAATDTAAYFGHPSASNEAEIRIDTTQAGSPQISFTEHGDMSWAIGGDDADNSFKIHGFASATVPTINGLAVPIFELTTSGRAYVNGDEVWDRGNLSFSLSGNTLTINY